jgi:hypothetical protein
VPKIDQSVEYGQDFPNARNICRLRASRDMDDAPSRWRKCSSLILHRDHIRPCGRERFRFWLFFQKRPSSELKGTMIWPREHLDRRKAGLRFDRSERSAQYLATRGAFWGVFVYGEIGCKGRCCCLIFRASIIFGRLGHAGLSRRTEKAPTKRPPPIVSRGGYPAMGFDRRPSTEFAQNSQEGLRLVDPAANFVQHVQGFYRHRAG